MVHFKKSKLAMIIAPLSLCLLGCNDDNLDTDSIDAPNIYEFSLPVSYPQASTTLLLIHQLEAFIYSEIISDIGHYLGKEEVLKRLNQFYENGTVIDDPLSLNNLNAYDGSDTSTPIYAENLPSEFNLKQAYFLDSYSDVTIKQNMPGVFSDLYLRNTLNSEYGAFIGWVFSEIYDHDTYPDRLIQQCFTGIATMQSDDDNSTKHINMSLGVDYAMLALSYLKTTLPYYFINEHYLTPEALSTKSNSTENTSERTELEKHWDNAFGWLGANRGLKTSVSEYSDLNSDFEIDFNSEFNFYLIKEAIELDDNLLSETNFSGKLIQLFLNGRKVIEDNRNNTDLTYLSAINTISNSINNEIERLIAANIIRKINIFKDSARYFLSGDAFKRDYFTAWSELKGVSLSLQPIQNSTLSEKQFREIQTLISNSPELSSSFIANYLEELDEVVSILQLEFGFSDESIDSWH